MKLLLAAMCTMAVTGAAAEPLSLLGIELGNAPQFKQCDGDRVLPCINYHGKTVANARNAIIRIKSAPAFFKYQREGYGAPIDATVVNGKIESMSLFTTGLKSQVDVLGQLTAKFGNPSRINQDEVHNAFGAKFDSISASWLRGPQGSVVFHGVFQDTETGVIEMTSPAGVAATEAIFKAERANDPHL